MHYCISPSPKENTLLISVKFLTTTSHTTTILLPTWRPGRYKQQAFAARIKNLKAYIINQNDDRSEANVKKITGNSWKIFHKPKQKVEICYEYLDADFDAGSHAFVDLKNKNMLAATLATCCVYTDLQADEECLLELKNFPKNWDFACPLPKAFYPGFNGFDPKTNSRFFKAKNYEELSDTPILAGNLIKSETFEYKKLKVKIHNLGKIDLNLWKELVEGVKKLVAYEMDLFDTCPVDEYHFMIFSEPHPEVVTHAVEHQNCCLIYKNKDGISNKMWLKELLSTATHEFFHTWNIKAIRPQELAEYDYQNPQFFPTCYVAEGLTTYLTQIFLWKTGLEKWEDEEKNNGSEKNDFCRNVLYFSYIKNNLKNSLRDSSLNMWMDGLDSNLIFGVDPYIRGMLAWWIMDIEIIKQSKGKYSAADIMTLLWKNRRKNKQNIITYSEEDLILLVNKMCKKNLRFIWQKLFWETENLEAYIKNAAKLCGLKFTKQNILILSKKQEFAGYTLSINNKALPSQMDNFYAWSGLSFPKND